MASIALVTAHWRFPWFRQIPGGNSTLDGIRFTLNEIAEDCTFVVVYDDPGSDIHTLLPRERRLVILSEPPGIKTYHPRFLDQFGMVMGPVVPQNYSGRFLHTHGALPWFYGVGFTPDGLVANENVDTLLALPPPPKLTAISTVISRKAQLPKHRARLKLVEYLAGRLGDRFHVFGRGFRDVADKAEAIAPYAYHLVLENNDIDHFWTEKTADAFLGWSLPVFSGCANLGSYFPESSFIPLNIADLPRAAATLEEILEKNPHKSRLPAIATVREALLTRYNLFPILRRLDAEMPSSFAPLPQAEPICSAKTFRPLNRLRQALGLPTR